MNSRFPTAVHSPTVRAVALGILVLLLQIPLVLVSSLAAERQFLRDQVAAEIGEKWGRSQTVIGPWLEIPYEVHHDPTQIEHRTLRVLPRRFETDGSIDVQVRSRGIFDVPVYTTTLNIRGSFVVPEPEDADVVAWDRARLVVGVDDPSSIRGDSTLTFRGQAHPFEPAAAQPGIETSVSLGEVGSEPEFSLSLTLAGTEQLSVVPVGEHSNVAMRSSWPHPSFQGSWLPDEHRISPDGFEAHWEVSSLARGFPTLWSSDAVDMLDRLRSAAIGVRLGASVDHYVMSGRSTRYAILFFAAVFGVLWVMELRGGYRLHPMHYLLTGAALCSFHLLILAFAEHLGFGVAYVLAAGMVTLLLIYYAHGALRSAMGAASVGATCMGIYGYLYVCLANEDHALLFGAVGVFVGIATTMALTRRLAYVAPVLDGPEAASPTGSGEIAPRGPR